jgi:nucleolar MIF4G domain-containing protein 1
MSLKDIQNSDKKGKWWLVGASWAGKPLDSQVDSQAGQRDGTDRDADNMDGQDDGYEGLVLATNDGSIPDLSELTREQMMNTDVRRSIFVAIMSASDYEDAYTRLLKLQLNKTRQREIPNVIMQCVGAERQYNPYYTLVARKICSDRKARWSFQDCLWKLFRRLGESVFGDEVDDEDEDEAIDLRRLVNTAKMFGVLIAHGALSLAVLKCLNLPYLQPQTRNFVEVMLVTLILECQKQDAVQSQTAVAKVFSEVEDNPQLARGLRWTVKHVIRKSDLAGGKANTRIVKAGCKVVEEVLERALAADVLASGGS